MPKKDHKRINLALQGGGAHGAFAWGIIDQLFEDDRVIIDSISATSAGAMNAVVLASGFIQGGPNGARNALRTFWQQISEAGYLFNPLKTTPLEKLFNVKIEHSMSYFMFDLMNKVFSPYQLNPFNFNPLKDVLEKNVDFEAIQANADKIKVFISATNVKTGKIKIFPNEEITIDAVLASACLPFMFHAVQIGEEAYWDGGYMGNPAIFPLIYHTDCPDILILHTNAIQCDTVPQTATEIMDRVNEISFNSSLMREMRAIAVVNKMINNGWIKEEYRKEIKSMYFHAIRADIVMQSHSLVSKLTPNWSFLKLLFDEGRLECAAWIKKNLRHVGKKTTINIQEFL